MPYFREASRRRFLQGAAGLAGLAALPLHRVFGQESLVNVQLRPLGEQLALISGAGQNILAAGRDGEVLLVDGGSETYTDVVLDTVAGYFGAREVATLVNTHWHPEQTGLNLALGRAGTSIVAHENTRLWLGTETIVRWQDRVYPPMSEPAIPTKTFHGTYNFEFGGEPVECGYLVQAHTDGDIYVHFKERDVLAVGGVVSSDGWPVIDWSTAGWIGGMVQALERLLRVAGPDTLIVPATGMPIDRAELAAQHEMYSAVMARLKVMMESGYGVAEVLRDRPAAGYKPGWGSPDLFLALAFKSFWGHVRQFDVV